MDLKVRLATYFAEFRRLFRQTYNTLNSGKHVEIDPYTDAVIDLQESIEVEMIEGTYILEISVTWPNPQTAAMAANMLAEVYVDRARQDSLKAGEALEAALREEMVRGESNFAVLEGQINALRLSRAANYEFLRVIEKATPPVYPSFPKVVINTAFAIVGWMFVTAFALIAIDTFNPTIKTPSDLRRVLDARYLGRVQIKRPARWPVADAERVLRSQSNGAAKSGGTLTFGPEHASQALFDFVNSLLARSAPAGANRPTVLLKLLHERQESERAGNAIQAANPNRASLRIREGRDLHVLEQQISEGNQAEDPAHEPVDIDGPQQTGLKNFGSVDAGFAFSQVESTEWMVIGLYPGEITETELRNTVEQAHLRGVRDVFGVLLKG